MEQKEESMRRHRKIKWIFGTILWDFGLDPSPMIAVQKALTRTSQSGPIVNLWRLGARVSEEDKYSQVWLGLDKKELSRESWHEIWTRVVKVVKRPMGRGQGESIFRGLYYASFSVCKRRKLTRVESAIQDCIFIAKELGVDLNFPPVVAEELDVFVEPNYRMSLGMKLWEEARIIRQLAKRPPA